MNGHESLFGARPERFVPLGAARARETSSSSTRGATRDARDASDGVVDADVDAGSRARAGRRRARCEAPDESILGRR